MTSGTPPRALVVGASGGVGGALAAALTLDGWRVEALSRARDGLDLTRADTIPAATAARSEARYDLIVNAAGVLTVGGVPPEKSIARLDPAVMAQHFAINATGVALLLKHFSPLLAHRDSGGRAVFASLSARVGSIGDNRAGGWISYRASKAAQNQIIRTASIEIGRRHRGAIVVALHPGTVDTSLSRDFGRDATKLAPQDSARHLLRVIAGLRREDNGGFFDWRGDRVEW